MRAFVCQAFSASDPAPSLATILAQDAERAGALARRVLIEGCGAERVEIHEDRELVWVERIAPPAQET